MSRVHNMKLNDSPFDKIKSGQKVVELRLYDDKRRGFNINDYIVFSRVTDSSDKIAVSVRALYIFPTFRDLYEDVPLKMCGFEEGVSVEVAVERIHRIYTVDDEELYGVVGIKVALADLADVLELEKRTAEAEFDHYFPDGMK